MTKHRKQPTSPEEEARCKEAMEGCPVEAIGNNG
jgi:ferredoxin